MVELRRKREVRNHGREKTMRENQDAFGHALYDRLEGKDALHVVEREDGYVDVLNPAGYFTAYKDWWEIEKRAMRFVRGRVLDIGCGAGRHSLHFQGKGLDVLGIDISPLAVEVCKLRGLRRAQVLSISQVSSKLGTFDTILMMGHNFGLFGSFEGARRLLGKFHRITHDRSRIVASVRDPYDTVNPIHLGYQERNRKRGRMSGQIRLRVRYKQYKEALYDYLFVSRDEMGEILEGTGWRATKFVAPESPSYGVIIEKGD